MNIDPASDMLKQYKKNIDSDRKLVKHQTFANRKQSHQVAAKPDELDGYLKGMSSNELESIMNSRKSTKNLDGGPMIFS